jgi:hypothetical protein
LFELDVRSATRLELLVQPFDAASGRSAKTLTFARISDYGTGT